MTQPKVGFAPGIGERKRLNEEIRRRERVMRMFPNDQAAKRIVGALLAEKNDDWQERAYFDMAEYHEWKAITGSAPMISQKGRTAV